MTKNEFERAVQDALLDYLPMDAGHDGALTLLAGSNRTPMQMVSESAVSSAYKRHAPSHGEPQVTDRLAHY